MSTIILSVLFAVVWAAITGSATVHNLIFGFALSLLALVIVRGSPVAHKGAGKDPRKGPRWRVRGVLSLVTLFFKELALSAWKVAVMVTRRDMALKPGIFAFPLTVDRDFEITLLANLITLTPGTLSVDVSDDRKLLYVHAIDCSDIEATRRDIAEGFERKIMEAFR